jgi:hypothetical protein
MSSFSPHTRSAADGGAAPPAGTPPSDKPFFPYFITLRGKKQSPQASRSFLRFAPTSHFPSAKPMSLNRLFVLQILRVQAYNEREKRVMPLKGGLHHG